MARKSPPPPSRMQDVLLTVLEERLYADGHNRDQLAATIQRLGGTAASLSRLVNGQAKSPRQGIDVLVDAYADVIGCDPLDLWADALARWRTIRSAEDAWISDWRVRHADALRYRALQTARESQQPKKKPATRQSVRRKIR